MNDIENTLKVFGLSKGAARTDIRDAFRDLFEMWNPVYSARNKAIYRKKRKEIQAAYKCLRAVWESFEARPANVCFGDSDTVFKPTKGTFVKILKILGIKMIKIPAGS